MHRHDGAMYIHGLLPFIVPLLVTPRILVLELEERHGWEALGYRSMTACLIEEFPQESKTKLIRTLEAGRIERHLQQVPIGTYLEGCVAKIFSNTSHGVVTHVVQYYT